MGSLNAKAVALEVVKTVEKGGKVNHRSLLKKYGYSQKVADNPYKVTQTKSYQAIVIPALKRMEDLRTKALAEANRKDLSKEKYATLVQSADILTKNIQLLNGKSTENVAMVIEVSEAIQKKNATKNDNSQMSDK